MRNIIKNSIITPDGTELISKYRHHYVEHNDKNGKTYAIDGGNEYLRRVGDMSDCEETSIFEDEDISKIRNYFKWGTYGPNGDQPLKHILLKDMDEDHIEAILRTQTHLTERTRNIFKKEIEFRKSLN